MECFRILEGNYEVFTNGLKLKSYKNSGDTIEFELDKGEYLLEINQVSWFEKGMWSLITFVEILACLFGGYSRKEALGPVKRVFKGKVIVNETEKIKVRIDENLKNKKPYCILNNKKIKYEEIENKCINKLIYTTRWRIATYIYFNIFGLISAAVIMLVFIALKMKLLGIIAFISIAFFFNYYPYRILKKTFKLVEV